MPNSTEENVLTKVMKSVLRDIDLVNKRVLNKKNFK